MSFQWTIFSYSVSNKMPAYRMLLNFCGHLRSCTLCGESFNVAIFILDNGSMARNKEGIGIGKY